MTQALPTGTITFLFTDLENSTRLWEQHPEAMKAALQRHDAILRQAIEGKDGMVVKTTGDGCMAVFRTSQQALRAVLTAQQAIENDPWMEIAPQALRVRMALHSGEAETREGDYFGPVVNRAARLMAAGYGGQVLLSDITAGLSREQLPAGVTLRDLGEHHLKDLTSPEHIFQLQVPGLQAEFPALKTFDAFPNNLPAQLTSFIGRRGELAATAERLATTRLLTLIGPGGTGKTRLAVQLGSEVFSQYPDGVWLVELAPVSDPGLLLQTVAAVLNLRELPGITLPELVTSYLQSKRSLLILDNCEHLVEACARLADDLLRICPKLKILASSREGLGTAGESVYPLPSLRLPPQPADSRYMPAGSAPVQLADLESIRQSEAVQLFVERATAVQPRFALTEQNAAAVAQVCRRLDGIPLAIELAAVRVRLLMPEQIAARLDDRFRLLTGGSRAALPRQQTLQALIDWSYDLLSWEEQGLFRRLAVFSGGWTLEAAEAICPDFDVLELLATLVNKSLVATDEMQEESMHYRMLETIRQYGLERLLEAGETTEARDRHLHYYLQVAEAREQDYNSPREIRLLDAWDLEHDNFRAALQWALERNPDALLRLAGSLAIFWSRRGHNLEGYNWLQQALGFAASREALTSGDLSSLRLARAKALMGLGSALTGQGQYKRASAAYAEAEGLYRDMVNPQGLAFAIGMHGFSALQAGDFDLARSKLQESVAFGRQIGDQLTLAMSLGVYGFFLLVVEGEVNESKQCYLESGQYSREIGSPWILAQAGLGLGRLAEFEGQPEKSRQHFLEAEAIYQSMGDRFFVNVARSERAHTERRMGNLEIAESLYRGCLPVWVELGQKAAVTHELECLAYIDIVQGRPVQAARLLGAAQVMRETIDIKMQPAEQIEYEGKVAALKKALDEVTLEAAWASGRQMDVDQVIALALSD